MSYFIVWNIHSHDHHIQLDEYGFVECYGDYDEAVKEADFITDNEDFREYTILEDKL